MKYYEEILVFGTPQATYHPQMKDRVGEGKDCYRYDHYCGASNHASLGKAKKKYDPMKVQPSDVLEFDVVPNRSRKLHPAQKPVDLLRYLVLTYTNPGDTVLDATIGSGSTAIACIKENRHFIGFELDKCYFNTAQDRVKEEQMQPSLCF